MDFFVCIMDSKAQDFGVMESYAIRNLEDQVVVIIIIIIIIILKNFLLHLNKITLVIRT